jgi:biotin transport system substrate-specific component
MNAASVAPTPARRIVLADLLPGEAVRDLVLILSAAAFVGAAAQFTIPVPGSPVPVTGSTFAVLLSGAALGWQRGLAAMMLYLAAGSLGVPWFAAGGHGFGGPSFGYIFGYVLAAGLVGFMAQRGFDRTPARTVLAMLLGTLTIYAIGVPWLMDATGMDLSTALDKGVRPFLLGDLLKVLLAAALLPAAWKLVQRRSR